MRLKRMMVGLASAALTVTTMGVITTAPAQAASRDDFRDMALLALDEMNRDATLPLCQEDPSLPKRPLITDTDCQDPHHDAWILAYRARLTAFKDGWHATSTQNLLNQVYGEWKTRDADPTDDSYPDDDSRKVSNPYGGYGESNGGRYYVGNYSRPTRSTHAAQIVTTTDHVGEVLLEGYDAGAVPFAQVKKLANSVYNWPKVADLAGNIPGDCLAYTDNVGQDTYCALNVSVGGAAFMRKLVDRGILPDGTTLSEVNAWIESLRPAIEAWYQIGPNDGKGHVQGDFAQDENAYMRPGYWPYAYFKPVHSKNADQEGAENYDGKFTSNPQDWNHQAYMIESVKTLGWENNGDPYALDSAEKLLIGGADYSIDAAFEDNLSYAEEMSKHGFGVVGRMRLQSLYPDMEPRNLINEAVWFRDGYIPQAWRPAYTWGQFGSWAARLAGNAHADAAKVYNVDLISHLRIFEPGWSGRGTSNDDIVPRSGLKKGVEYVFYADARMPNGMDAPNGTDKVGPDFSFVTGAEMILRRPNGVVLDRKDTGFDWRGVRFIRGFANTGNQNVCVALVKDQTTLKERCYTLTVS